MNEHANVEHSEAAKFQCRHCGRRFGNTQAVRKHELKHEEPRFKCSHCDKMLKTRKTLLIHEREHTGERPFTCSVCGNGYKSDNVLSTHMKHVHGILTPGMKPIEKRVRKKKKGS